MSTPSVAGLAENAELRFTRDATIIFGRWVLSRFVWLLDVQGISGSVAVGDRRPIFSTVHQSVDLAET